MSFSITKSYNYIISVESLGGFSEIGGEADFVLTFTASYLDYFTSDNICNVIFTIESDKSFRGGTLSYSFKYSGSGSPLLEAESLLEKELSGSLDG
jgi:hypothetical protein